MAVPPLAETPSKVWLATVPPSTPTEPTVSPTPMALPALPPLLTSAIEIAPPLAEPLATPPFPAEAVSVNCMMLSPSCSPSDVDWFDHPRGGSPTTPGRRSLLRPHGLPHERHTPRRMGRRVRFSRGRQECQRAGRWVSRPHNAQVSHG